MKEKNQSQLSILLLLTVALLSVHCQASETRKVDAASIRPLPINNVDIVKALDVRATKLYLNEDGSLIVVDQYKPARPSVWRVSSGQEIWEAHNRSYAVSYERGWLIAVRRNFVEVFKVGSRVESYNRFPIAEQEKGISVSGVAIIDPVKKLFACAISRTDPVVESWIQIFDFDGHPVGARSEESRGTTIRLIQYVPHLSAIAWPQPSGKLEFFDSSTLERRPEADLSPGTLVDRLMGNNAIGQFEFFEEGDVLAFASGDNTVRVRSFSQEIETVYEFTWLQNGWVLAFAREAGTFVGVAHNRLALWGGPDQEILALFSGDFAPIISVSADGSVVAVLEKTGREHRRRVVRIYRTDDLLSAYARSQAE